MLIPAISPYIIEPIWQQLSALLPRTQADHPLGYHRPRIPDRVIFEKLMQVLVFGCAYQRIADESCSSTTLRRRRDEWIDAGVMDALREMALEAYDRTIGLKLADVAVDCCITKAPCGARRRTVTRWIGESKASTNARRWWTPVASPSGSLLPPANRHDSPLLSETLDTLKHWEGYLSR